MAGTAHASARPQIELTDERISVSKAEILRIARLIEHLKRPCGIDPESPVAIQNGRYMSIAAILRALAVPAPDQRLQGARS